MKLTRRALFAALAAPFLPKLKMEPAHWSKPNIAFASGFEYGLGVFPERTLCVIGGTSAGETYNIRSATIYFVNGKNEVIEELVLPLGYDALSWGKPSDMMKISCDAWQETS